MHRPWVLHANVFADPGHADTVYVTNLQMWEVQRRGVSFTEITTPHGDNHDLWIDPRQPAAHDRRHDGGRLRVVQRRRELVERLQPEDWRSSNRLDVDNQQPLSRLRARQQDNTTISGPAPASWGAITLADCTYLARGERLVAVHLEDRNIVYCGAVGSSPGGAGALQRYDTARRQIRSSTSGPKSPPHCAKDMKYRFAWTSRSSSAPATRRRCMPAATASSAPRDEGSSWDAISPD